LQAVSRDHNTRTELKKIIEELEKEEFLLSFKKFVNVIARLIATLFGLLRVLGVQWLIRHFSK
jgi:hypothetical protein